MRTICIFNHKGGVGKTTTAVNIAAGLSRHDKKILLIDMDPQSNIAVSLRVQPEYNLYDALTGKVPFSKCIVSLAKNLDVVTSRENLAKAEYYLSQQNGSRQIMKELLSPINGYDFLLIDCPPSLGLLNQHALAFCKEAFIPVSTDFLGVDALKKMEGVITEINKSYKNNLVISKVIPTLYDRRSRIAQESLDEIKKLYPEAMTVPIRNNSKLKEAPKHGKSIFSYARNSPGAKDYAQLVEEILKMGTLRVTEEIVA